MRLRDYGDQDPILSEAARLVRAGESDEPGPWLQQRVRNSLGPQRRRVRLPRVAVAGVLVLTGALAGATAWRAHERAVARRATPPATMTPRTASHHATPISPKVVPTLVEPTSSQPSAGDSPIPQPRVTDAPTADPTPATSVARTPLREPSDVPLPRDEPPSATPPPSAPELSSDASLLQRATRAWKHEHDAATTAQLADEHLRRFPSSDLREEAFALSMDAHAQLADGTALGRARRYLEQFPSGRFHDRAAQLAR